MDHVITLKDILLVIGLAGVAVVVCGALCLILSFLNPFRSGH